MLSNILITSAGRRVSLVKNFQKTLKEFNKSSKVIAIDCNPTLSSACYEADEFYIAPRVTEPFYREFLLNFCIEKKISIVVPTIDTELSLLAKLKDEFLEHNILIAISSKKVCDTFYLKDSTEQFFTENGFLTPKSIDNLENCNYPLFAKLNNSSCSVGAKRVESYTEAKELFDLDSNYIFQEFIDAREFTVDAFIDKKGKVISIVPRERLEVRAGEVNKALAVKDELIITKIKEFCNTLTKAYGTVTIQVFKRGSEIIFIEVNPRFGGGYPLSYLAGADFAKFLIEDYLNKSLEYREDWRDKTLMLRYDAEVIVNDFKG